MKRSRANTYESLGFDNETLAPVMEEEENKEDEVLWDRLVTAVDNFKNNNETSSLIENLF